MSEELQKKLINNGLWFAASLIVALLVWFVATIQANPIQERSFTRIPINILVDDGMIITDQSSETAQVFVRSQQAISSRLQQDDLTITVDLRGRGSGSYTEALDVQISRQASADTRPAQITVTIEQETAQQVEVEIALVPPPRNFAAESVNQDIFQAEVRGSSEDVTRVTRILAEFDLSDQQNPELVERLLTLVAVDENNNPVDDVSITPATVLASVDVIQRPDVETFSITPDILTSTLPENFAVSGVVYDPETVILNGAPEILATLGDTIETEPISLDGRTSNFTIDVLLDLPDDLDLAILSDTRTVTVDIFISEQTSTLPLENIPVTVIGMNQDLQVEINPLTLSDVVLIGPASVIDTLVAEDIQVIVDVNGLLAGTYTLTPQVEILRGQVDMSTINTTLLPTNVSVIITEGNAESTQVPEATETP